MPVCQPVSATVKYTRIREIESYYDLFLIDLWGVMHNGIDAYPTAITCVNTLLANQKKVCFITNMPRPKSVVVQTLDRYGVMRGYNVVTSGDVTEQYIQDHYPHKTAYHFGASCNQDIGKNLIFTDDLALADYVLVTQFTDQPETLSLYDDTLQRIAQSGLPVLCANPDLRAHFGSNLRITAGYFADRLKNIGSTVTYIGKPYAHVFEQAARICDVDFSKMIMIGDSLDTDILGADRLGIDSYLTLCGVSGSVMEASKMSLDQYAQSVGMPLPTYMCDFLAY